ncbi:hypothetical protein V2J09_010950 [Rumex salicifolius]
MEASMSKEKVKYPGLREVTWFGQFIYGSNPWMARYIYGLLFLITNLLAWAVRDYEQSALAFQRLQLKGCEGSLECLGTAGVLLGTSKLHDRRDTWQSEWWSAKALLFVLLMILPFLVPNEVIDLYGQIAHFGAGVFLLVQLVSVISFITWLNDSCLSENRIHVISLAMASHFISFVGIILLYVWYAPETSCELNISFITSTLALLILMTGVSVHPKVNAGFLAPGLVGLYVVFICWCAIRSEPPGIDCNRKAEATRRTDWLTIISFVVAMLAMVIATFSTGIDSQCFQFRKTESKDEEDVPYSYGFFHLVFSAGAMYFAMLLVSWNSHHSMKKWTIDVGWTSTWVKIVNVWVAACYGCWWLQLYSRPDKWVNFRDKKRKQKTKIEMQYSAADVTIYMSRMLYTNNISFYRSYNIICLPKLYTYDPITIRN